MSIPIIDSMRSLISGLGDPLRDKNASTFYSDQVLSDDQIYNAYRNSWIARKAVDIPALDALSNGRIWQAEQGEVALLKQEEARLNLWNKLLACKTMARLWGGAAIVIGTKDQDMAEPLDFELVGKGGLIYLTVLSRRDLGVVSLSRDPMSEYWSKPEMYQLSGSVEGPSAMVHPSRLVVQVGAPSPDPWLAVGSVFGWGDSILQALYAAMQNADGVAANVASLVFEANVDTIGIPGLMEQLGSDTYRKQLIDRFALANAAKSITKTLLLDTEEEFERNPAVFSALPDVIGQYLLMVAGAADIPLTRFLGQAPTGMSSTGEGDMRNYYDRIAAIQTLELQPAIYRLDEVLIRSALGSRPDGLYYQWAPLKQTDAKEQSEIGLNFARAAVELEGLNLFTAGELRTVVGNQMVASDIYPGLGELLSGKELE